MIERKHFCLYRILLSLDKRKESGHNFCAHIFISFFDQFFQKVKIIKCNLLLKLINSFCRSIFSYTGLRYDDLYDPYFELDIKEALGRLPREVVDARNQRLKRAMDLSMKHEYLPEDLQVLCLFSFHMYSYRVS